jgi:septal ring factor EnvC (AmiA/AmiB activator)
MKKRATTPRFTERLTQGIGSVPSLIVHTIFFLSCFLAAFLGLIELNTMLLVLTTLVSLEAIYLAIFIQMTVNENTESLREVEEDIDEIQEDVEELGEDMGEIQEDIEEMTEDLDEMQEDLEEMTEDLEEMQEDEKREREQAVTIEQLTTNIRQVLEDLEALKKRK